MQCIEIRMYITSELETKNSREGIGMEDIMKEEREGKREGGR